MHPFAFWTIRAASVMAILAASTGCQRAPETTSEPSPPAAAESSMPPVAVDSCADPEMPEGVLQAYVWTCDDGRTIRMRNLLRENAITIEMHEGGRKLPRVVSASGARYSDGSLTFWTKGDTALLEREGSAPLNCRQDRFQSLLADARVRGVVLRGTGNEPGWTVEVGPGSRLEFVTNYGADRHRFDAATESVAGGVRIYTATDGARSIKVTVTAEPCTDDMSGASFDQRVAVEFGEQAHRGCGTALQ